MSRPLVIDIDGTMSRPDRSIEGRVFDAIRAWEGPIVVATGKAFPYPVALCDFIGIPIRVIAENGGVVCSTEAIRINGDREQTRAFVADLKDSGHDLGWGEVDLVNRWRETEVAVARDIPRDAIDEVANRHGLEVIDSQYAYHIKSPTVSKGLGLQTIATLLDLDPESFVAVGDSENDVSTFELVETSFAVANADESAKAVATTVTDGAYADGLLEALSALEG